MDLSFKHSSSHVTRHTSQIIFYVMSGILLRGSHPNLLPRGEKTYCGLCGVNDLRNRCAFPRCPSPLLAHLACTRCHCCCHRRLKRVSFQAVTRLPCDLVRARLYRPVRSRCDPQPSVGHGCCCSWNLTLLRCLRTDFLTKRCSFQWAAAAWRTGGGCTRRCIQATSRRRNSWNSRSSGIIPEQS